LSVSTIVQICAALLLAAILITSNLKRSTQRDDPYVPVPSTALLPQALPQWPFLCCFPRQHPLASRFSWPTRARGSIWRKR